MKKLLINVIFTIPLLLSATENINYNGDIQNIKLSKDSWNRLIFDSEVNANPIYSKEKNVEIHKANKSVFIKFKPMVKIEVQNKRETIKEIDYNKSKKAELFVSTSTATYSFTIEPTKSDAKTYFIQNIQTKNKNLLKFEIDPVRKVIKNITKGIFINKAIKNYEKKQLLKNQTTNKKIGNLSLTPKYIFIGKRYKAYLYDVIAIEDINTPINNKIFLTLDLKNKRSISIKDKYLSKNQTTQLVIITDI